MKALTIVLTLVAVAYAVPKYRSFEGINVKDYRDDKDRLDCFYQCIKGEGVCDKLDANFKARGEKIVETNCEDCREQEKYITRDLLSLMANEDPYKLHTIMQVFDPESKNSRSFLLWLRQFKSLAGIPGIPEDVIDEFHDVDDGIFGDNAHNRDPNTSKPVKKSGILGALRILLRGVLGVVGV